MNEEKKYQIIYADPPWKYGSKSAVNNTKGSEIKKLSEHYNSMSTEDICNLSVEKIIEKDSACFLWVTNSHLEDGLKVLRAWGFKPITIAFIWVKKTKNGNTCKNVAPWTMQSCEICLLGTRGRMTKYKTTNNIEQLVEAERTKHSKKPKEVKRRIEQLFRGLNKIELFAREKSEDWDVWGNEVKSDIEL